MDDNIGSLIRKLEDNYISGTTTISKHVEVSMSDTIETIYAYLNSKHISGAYDSQGREKPFFNIVIAAVNIWYRATDIDRSQINLKPTKREDVLKVFIFNILLQEYMRKNNMGAFFNQWGLTLARFGTAVAEFVEKNGELHSSVLPWNRIIVDAVDGRSNPIIKPLELTPAQLRQNKAYDQNIVEQLIASAQKARETLTKNKKDNLNDYIKVYEIHGELPLSYLTNKEEDEITYVQQMHVHAFVAGKKKGEYDEFTLVKGREDNPILITELIPEEGQTLVGGAVRNLFDAQWMVNHSQKAIKDQLDLASKLIFQTSDGNYTGRNALSAIENGDIMVHAVNQPLTQLQNNSHDISALQSFGGQWQQIGNEINSVSDAMKGVTPKSGTAWRQTEAILQESHSLFEIMTENKGFYIEEMLRKFWIPHLKKKMDSTEEITAILDEQGIKRIDSIYVPQQAIKNVNNKVIELAIDGVVTDQAQQAEMIEQEEMQLKQALSGDGMQRFIKPSDIDSKSWKESLGDFEYDIEIDITGEQRDAQSAMQTLTTVFQTLAQQQGQPLSEEQRVVFNKILTTAGHLSPVELPNGQEQPQSPQPQLQEALQTG